jgi:hypothetical protein
MMTHADPPNRIQLKVCPSLQSPEVPTSRSWGCQEGVKETISVSGMEGQSSRNVSLSNSSD